MACEALVISGPTGPTGPEGSPGSLGPTGAQGPTGASAPAGLTFYKGTAHLSGGVDVSISWPTFPTAVGGVIVSGKPGPTPNAFAYNINNSGATLASGTPADVSWLAYGT